VRENVSRVLRLIVVYRIFGPFRKYNFIKFYHSLFFVVEETLFGRKYECGGYRIREEFEEV